jgi:diguanylate cyclase (GGDEF)-like protein/PAS domain S-box-containing protein
MLSPHADNRALNPDSQAKRRALSRRLKFTAVALACSFVALISAIALFTRQSELVREATTQQTSLSGWQQQLQSVQILLMDAEAGVRAYLLTGQHDYLTAYDTALEQVPSTLLQLRAMPNVDGSMPSALTDLDRQAQIKLNELGAIIESYDRGGRDVAVALLSTDAGKRSSERVRSDVATAAAALRGYRKASLGRVATGSIDTQRLAIMTVAVLLISVLLAGLQIRRLMSAHQRYEQALAASELFVHAITDNVPVRLMYLDRNRCFQFVNQSVCDRLGKSRDELMGVAIKATFPDSAGPLFEGMIEAAFAGRRQRFEHNDYDVGEHRRMESYLTPDIGPDGEVRGVFIIGVDITHLKQVERALRDLTDVIDHTPDFVAQTNSRGELLYMNASARQALGYAATQSLEGSVFSDFYPAETNRRFAEEIIPAVKRNGSWIGETEVALSGGRVVPVSHAVIAHRDTRGRVARYSSLMRDITEEVSARRDLARQTATLNAVIESIPAMVAVWDPDMKYRLVNKAYVRWLGRRRSELVGANIEDILDAAEYRRSLPWAERAMAGETVTYEKEYATESGSKHLSFSYIPLHLRDGSVGGIVGVAHDITHHREENVRLMLLSERDPLTGLLNRAGFEKYLRSKTDIGDGASLAVLYVDLDHFKPINDKHGHATGDEVLREFAARLQALVRPTDAVSRLGGDEFGVVLAGVREPEHAAHVAEKVVVMARQPIVIGDVTLTIGASVGVAFDAEAEGGWKGLVARADVMAYQAKAKGRDQAALARRDEPTARVRRLSQLNG